MGLHPRRRRSHSRRARPYSPPAAIGDALLARFKQAVAQHVGSLPTGAHAALSQALNALGLLSQYADATPLLESLLAWRLGALRCVFLPCTPFLCSLTLSTTARRPQGAPSPLAAA